MTTAGSTTDRAGRGIGCAGGGTARAHLTRGNALFPSRLRQRYDGARTLIGLVRIAIADCDAQPCDGEYKECAGRWLRDWNRRHDRNLP